MNRFLALVCVFALSGCAYKGQTLPSFTPNFASADYQVLGRTNHEECGTYVFIDWGHLFKNEAASAVGGSSLLDILPIGGHNQETKRALYHALEKVPEATHLLEPRVRTTWNGFGMPPFFAFGRACSTVEARGVKILERPVPNAH